jgi:hypothetical protein
MVIPNPDVELIVSNPTVDIVNPKNIPDYIVSFNAEYVLNPDQIKEITTLLETTNSQIT